MSDKIFVPLIDYAKINAAMPCLDNIAHAGNELRVFDSFPTDSQDDFSPEMLLQVLNGLLLMVVVPLYWPLIGLNWIT